MFNEQEVRSYVIISILQSVLECVQSWNSLDVVSSTSKVRGRYMVTLFD